MFWCECCDENRLHREKGTKIVKTTLGDLQVGYPFTSFSSARAFSWVASTAASNPSWRQNWGNIFTSSHCSMCFVKWKNKIKTHDYFTWSGNNLWNYFYTWHQECSFGRQENKISHHIISLHYVITPHYMSFHGTFFLSLSFSFQFSQGCWM